MSSPAHAAPHADGHAHGQGHGHDHVPHVLPLSVYLGAWGALLVLTVLTVVASYFDFGSWNLVIALVIATMKAATVALLFMHLWFDHKFHAIILSGSLVFLAVFIAFTMFDTETRGRADAKEYERAADSRNPFAKAATVSTGAPIEVPLYTPPAAGGRGGLAPVFAPATPGSAPAAPAASGAAADPAPATSAAPATTGSGVPVISSAAPAMSAGPGAAPSASVTPRPFVPGGAASFTTRPALRGDQPVGPAAALMTSAKGAVSAAPSASAAAPPKPVPSSPPAR